MLFPQGEQHLIDMPVMPDRAGAEIELAGGLIDDHAGLMFGTSRMPDYMKDRPIQVDANGTIQPLATLHNSAWGEVVTVVHDLYDLYDVYGTPAGNTMNQGQVRGTYWTGSPTLGPLVANDIVPLAEPVGSLADPQLATTYVDQVLICRATPGHSFLT